MNRIASWLAFSVAVLCCGLFLAAPVSHAQDSSRQPNGPMFSPSAAVSYAKCPECEKQSIAVYSDEQELASLQAQADRNQKAYEAALDPRSGSSNAATIALRDTFIAGRDKVAAQKQLLEKDRAALQACNEKCKKSLPPDQTRERLTSPGGKSANQPTENSPAPPSAELASLCEKCKRLSDVVAAGSDELERLRAQSVRDEKAYDDAVAKMKAGSLHQSDVDVQAKIKDRSYSRYKNRESQYYLDYDSLWKCRRECAALCPACKQLSNKLNDRPAFEACLEKCCAPPKTAYNLRGMGYAENRTDEEKRLPGKQAPLLVPDPAKNPGPASGTSIPPAPRAVTPSSVWPPKVDKQGPSSTTDGRITSDTKQGGNQGPGTSGAGSGTPKNPAPAPDSAQSTQSSTPPVGHENMPQLDSGYTVHKPDSTSKGTALGYALVYRKDPSTAPVSCTQWAAASIAPPAGLPPFAFHLSPRDGNAPTEFHVTIWNYTGPGTYDLSNPRSMFSWVNNKAGQKDWGLMVRGNRSMLGAGSAKIKVNPDGSGTLTVEGFLSEPMIVKGPGTRPSTRPGSAELIWACNDPVIKGREPLPMTTTKPSQPDAGKKNVAAPKTGNVAIADPPKSAKPPNVLSDTLPDALPKGCCACVEKLELHYIGHNNDPAKSRTKSNDITGESEELIGHKIYFHEFHIRISYQNKRINKPGEKPGDLVLKWLEMSDRPPKTNTDAGVIPGEWANIPEVLGKYPGTAKVLTDGTFGPWTRHNKSCPLPNTPGLNWESNPVIQLNDIPAVIDGTSRVMNFDITVESTDQCSCKHKALQILAKQVLKNREDDKDTKFYSPPGTALNVGATVSGKEPRK